MHICFRLSQATPSLGFGCRKTASLIKKAPENTSRGQQNIRFSGYAEHQPDCLIYAEIKV